MSEKKSNVAFDTHKIKNYFVTGLVILLPVALTILIVGFFFNLLTRPFEGITSSLISSSGIFDGGFLFISEHQLILWTSKISIFILLIVLTILLGFFARWFFINWFIKIGETVLHRIPLIRSIYKTSQDVIHTIFQGQTKSFKQPVLVPYPNDYTWSLGLITREEVEGLKNTAHFTDPIAVFIPTTPNPTSGFLLLYEKKDVIFLDMSIEEALKYIISCGVIMTPIVPLEKEKAKKVMEEK